MPGMARSPCRTCPAPGIALILPCAAEPVCVLPFPSPPRLQTLSKTGRILTVLAMIKTTRIYMMKCSHYYCDAPAQQSFAKDSDRLRLTWV